MESIYSRSNLHFLILLLLRWISSLHADKMQMSLCCGVKMADSNLQCVTYGIIFVDMMRLDLGLSWALWCLYLAFPRRPPIFCLLCLRSPIYTHFSTCSRSYSSLLFTLKVLQVDNTLTNDWKNIHTWLWLAFIYIFTINGWSTHPDQQLRRSCFFIWASQSPSKLWSIVRVSQWSIISNILILLLVRNYICQDVLEDVKFWAQQLPQSTERAH